MIVQSAPITGRVFAALPGLRIVSVPGIGVDMVDLDAAREHGVWVAHVPDGNITEVACHALAMALSLIRHLPFYDAAVRAGDWSYAGTGPLIRPAKMTFGVVGLGKIGRLAAGLRGAGLRPHPRVTTRICPTRPGPTAWTGRAISPRSVPPAT